MKDFCNAKANLWPCSRLAQLRRRENRIIRNNPEISAYQRFTGIRKTTKSQRPRHVRMSRRRSPTAAAQNQKRPLYTNGWVGAFLGRSNSINGYFVDVGDRIVDGSSVSVDEEFFPYFARDKGGECRKPLTAPTKTKSNAADTGQGPGGGRQRTNTFRPCAAPRIASLLGANRKDEHSRRAQEERLGRDIRDRQRRRDRMRMVTTS